MNNNRRGNTLRFLCRRYCGFGSSSCTDSCHDAQRCLHLYRWEELMSYNRLVSLNKLGRNTFSTYRDMHSGQDWAEHWTKDNLFHLQEQSNWFNYRHQWCGQRLNSDGHSQRRPLESGSVSEIPMKQVHNLPISAYSLKKLLQYVSIGRSEVCYSLVISFMSFERTRNPNTVHCSCHSVSRQSTAKP